MSDTSETSQAIEEREFGFWLFLMSDAIIFALLFATYAVMSQTHWATQAPPHMFRSQANGNRNRGASPE